MQFELLKLKTQEIRLLEESKKSSEAVDTRKNQRLIEFTLNHLNLLKLSLQVN